MCHLCSPCWHLSRLAATPDCPADSQQSLQPRGRFKPCSMRTKTLGVLGGGEQEQQPTVMRSGMIWLPQADVQSMNALAAGRGPGAASWVRRWRCGGRRAVRRCRQKPARLLQADRRHQGAISSASRRKAVALAVSPADSCCTSPGRKQIATNRHQLWQLADPQELLCCVQDQLASTHKIQNMILQLCITKHLLLFCPGDWLPASRAGPAGEHPQDPEQAAAVARTQQGRHARRRHAPAARGDAGGGSVVRSCSARLCRMRLQLLLLLSACGSWLSLDEHGAATTAVVCLLHQESPLIGAAAHVVQ